MIFRIFAERIGRSSYLLTRVKSRHLSSSVFFFSRFNFKIFEI